MNHQDDGLPDISTWSPNSIRLANLNPLNSMNEVIIETHAPRSAKRSVVQSRDKVIILSYMTFWWITGLAKFGWSHEIKLPDLPQVGEKDKSRALADKVSDCMKQSSATDDSSPGITSALVKSFRSRFYLSMITALIFHAVEFGKVVFLKMLLDFLQDKTYADEEHRWKGHMISGLMLLAAVLSNVSQCIQQDLTLGLGTRVCTALRSIMFRKSMRISSVASQKSVGELVNLMSVDAVRFRKLIEFLNCCWSVPLDVAISTYLLYLELGVAAFAGLGIIIANMVLYVVVSVIMEGLQSRQMSLKDERVKTIGEVLFGIKVIKLNAWEEFFTKTINRIRRMELRVTRKLFFLESVNLFMWSLTPILVTLAVFSIYLANEESHLDPAKVFFSLGIFTIIRSSINDALRLMAQAASVSVSVKRINDFLDTADRQEYVTFEQDRVNAVTIRNGVFSWVSESPSLITEPSPQTISFKLRADIAVPRGSLTAIVGAVGSGKTSLIASMLGEMRMISGSVTVSSSTKGIAYVTQEAWIRNATIKENILFGSPYVKTKYDKIVKACELLSDFKLQPAGDETEIGEKGINLSGGQKQRISLARACYSAADLIFLDDPLSAVDSHVGKKLFDQVFSSNTGCLRGKTRILVTNSLSILKRVDKILVMDDGMISESGSYSQLINSGGAFARFLEEFAESDSEDDDDLMETDDTFLMSVSPMTSFAGSISGASLRRSTMRRRSSRRVKVEKVTNVPKPSEFLIEEEKLETGSVKMRIFFKYFRYFKFYLLFLTIIFALGYAISDAASLFWLSLWAQDHGRWLRYESSHVNASRNVTTRDE